MQNGSLIRSERQRGPDVWEFRRRELAGNGKRRHRRIVIGSGERLVDEAAARQAVSALCIDINAGDARIKREHHHGCRVGRDFHPAGCVEDWDFEADRLAQVSPHVFLPAQTEQDGYYSVSLRAGLILTLRQSHAINAKLRVMS